MPEGEPGQTANSAQRHALLTIDPRAWPAIIGGHAHADMPLLAAWAAKGWPVICRRPGPEDRTGELPVGVPLPPAQNKRRIALSVPPAAVTRRQALPRLDHLVAVAPPAWRQSIDALLALAHRFDVTPLCFGSLCWQFRTGLNYITNTSDLDLVWPASACSDIAALLQAVARVEQTFPPRIDGEVVFADGRAVNWRELHQGLNAGGETQILVKTSGGVSLTPIGMLFNSQCAA
jgi:phosphoribosyl-dephospho-CoA transferase